MKQIAIIVFLSLVTLTGFSQNIPCPDFVCESDINLTAYSVPATLGSTYAWNITGGNIVAGQGTNTIQVDWSATIPGNYAVEVIETDINVGITIILSFLCGDGWLIIVVLFYLVGYCDFD